MVSTKVSLSSERLMDMPFQRISSFPLTTNWLDVGDIVGCGLGSKGGEAQAPITASKKSMLDIWVFKLEFLVPLIPDEAKVGNA